MIVGEALLDVDLDFVVENARQLLAHPRIVQLDQPDIDILDFAINDVGLG